MITLRQMTLADIPFGLKLSTDAGWNQTATDWQLILSQRGARGLLASLDGVAAGTVTIIPYQARFSWVGMALVSAKFQRRGIGTALLTAATDVGKAAGWVRLDATPAGKKLYDTLGFRDEYLLSRLRRPAQALTDESEIPCVPITHSLLSAIGRLDQPVFGADRLSILSGLYRHAPQLAYAWVENNEIKGYCLGRIGIRYAHIGPIVAVNIQIARGLLRQALSGCAQQDTILDAPQQDGEWLAFLSTLGFSELRPFIRMCYGEGEPPMPDQRQFAIAGPELG
jgi:GNAT superfamily N-acetyltransferase